MDHTDDNSKPFTLKVKVVLSCLDIAHWKIFLVLCTRTECLICMYLLSSPLINATYLVSQPSLKHHHCRLHSPLTAHVCPHLTLIQSHLFRCWLFLNVML